MPKKAQASDSFGSPCSLEGQLYPGVHQQSGGQEREGGNCPLCSTLRGSHLEHCIQNWDVK